MRLLGNKDICSCWRGYFCVANVHRSNCNSNSFVIAMHLMQQWGTPKWHTHFMLHGAFIRWKHFLRYWPFVRGIHRWHKGQWHGALVFSLINAWTKCWENNRNAGDLTPSRSFWRHCNVFILIVFHDDMIRLCYMMTSSNGNIFRVTGPLCGEFIGSGEFPAQRPVTRSLDVFFDRRLNKRLSKQPWGWWFETPSWSLWRQCNGNEKLRC